MIHKFKAIGMVIFIFVFALHCGKKGPLVLEPELTPQPVNNLQLTQMGQTIKLQWDFPTQLTGNTQDKERLQMLQEDIRQIYIYYANKEIPGDKFQKKADVLRKLTLAELTPLISQTENKKGTSFSITLPFSLKNLENKQHFFSVQYDYRRMKSPLCNIAYIATMIPVKPVEGLSAKRENKIVKLTWSRPSKDVADKPTTNITGYHVFRSVAADETDPANQTAEPKKTQPTKKTSKDTSPTELSRFVKINSDKILMEYFEDTDTGVNGKYSYYVSVVMANNIESAPSAEISLPIVDSFPPEIPANLVCFKAEDHMFLTWQVVPDKDFSHFRVYRSLDATAEFTLLADKVTANQYKDKTVTKGKTYFYMVTAADKKGNESQYSNMAREQF